MTEKDQQFTRMWNEANKSKQEKFRNLMKSKLAARQIIFNEGNARAFWNGDVALITPEKPYEERPREERFERRRPPPRGRGPPRRR
ncbi:MAG: hypothetical protein E6K10_02130 [Methanobacteriota archaeon]|nr:MAG: hypothetical protein E6K10_02130 [Euryarchaeota archaeon]